MLVLHERPVVLGHPLGKAIGAAVKDLGVVRSEFLSDLFQELAVNGQERDVGEHREEVRDRPVQRIFQSIVVKRLDADLFPVRDLTVVVLLAVLHGLIDYVGVLRGVGGIEAVLVGGYPVMGGDFAVHLTVVGHPLDARLYLESPHKAVIADGPALRQARLDNAQVVVLNQPVNQVGCQTKLKRGACNKIVQAGELAGVDRIVVFRLPKGAHRRLLLSRLGA